MEKGFKIEIKNKEQVQIEPVNLSVDEFIVLGGAGLELALKTAYNQLEEQLTTDEEKKELRAALYDRLIILVSNIASEIYPEYVELYAKTPEAFLAELDEKVKQLNAKDSK
jgi:hypothetical protein